MRKRLTYLICSLMVLSLVPAAYADLIGWWKFDEGSGTLVADSSGNGHDGTINGNPVWTTGMYNGALQFDGSGDYVMCNLLDIDTSATGGMTVCGWIMKSSGGDRKICSNRQAANAAGGGFSCTIYQDRMEMDICSASARTLARDAGGNTVPTDTWAFLAWVFDDAGDVFKEYHNGVLADSDPVTISVGVSTANFRIGADSPTLGLYYLGSMDDWRVYDHVLTEAELQDAMAGKGPNPQFAADPSPEDGATDVVREVVLSWTSGELAATHDVYLGTVLADVEQADRDNPMGVLVSKGQEESAFDAGRLEFGQVYYWRIDEVNGAPDYTIYKGAVWSFTVEPYSYPIPGAQITATASSAQNTMGAANTINESGLNESDQHGTETSTMWLTTSTGPHWIQYEFDEVYVLDELWVWNHNSMIESTVGFGAKQVTVEYSQDGLTWTTLEGVPEFAQASGSSTYTANTTVEFGGVPAKYVKLTIDSTWSGAKMAGLSEVRFFCVPLAAWSPSPEDGAVDVPVETTLSWRTGRQAASHQVFVGTDANDLSLVAPGDGSAYELDLNLDETYYWQVIEVNDAEAIPQWTSEVWSFSTVAATVLDDFESYTDDMDAGEAIFQTWIDGYDVASNGSVVGLTDSVGGTFSETTIVHSGAQSMPFYYDNSGGVTNAEAEWAFDDAQDWTQHGYKTLSLAFYGDPNNTGTMYLKINNTKLVYNGDASDITKAQWQPWNIDLTSTGVSLTSVKKLAIGVDGAGAAGTLYFDDIQVYGTATEYITPIDPGTTGLVAWYKFDGDLKDSAGAYHGTAVGDAKTATDATRGQVLVLDGVGDAVDVPSLGSVAALTIAMWVDATVDPTPTQFFSFFNSDGWAAGDLHWRYSYGEVNSGLYGLSDISGTAIAKANQWNHVAVTVSDTEWALWLNGYKEASRALSAVQTVTLGDGLIGAWMNGTSIERPFTGKIDDVRFYNRALSQEEIGLLAGRTAPFAKPF